MSNPYHENTPGESERMIIRDATSADLAQFYGKREGGFPTVIAKAGIIGGDIVGVGGVSRVGGRRIAFCDISERGRSSKIAIARTARRLLDGLRRQAKANCRPLFIYAVIDRNEPGARRWLSSLGFEAMDEKEGVFRWQA